MRWAEATRRGGALALFALLAAGCASGGAARKESPQAAKPVAASAVAAAPLAKDPALADLPPDSLVIFVTGTNAYTVQDATTTCEGLRELIEPYRQTNLVATGAQGVTMTIADVICVGMVARQRGGKAYMTHPEGLRSIDVQN